MRRHPLQHGELPVDTSESLHMYQHVWTFSSALPIGLYKYTPWLIPYSVPLLYPNTNLPISLRALTKSSLNYVWQTVTDQKTRDIQP